ncbi:hypothetical protein ACTFIW_011850 [Dictyostelium discoideum]
MCVGQGVIISVIGAFEYQSPKNEILAAKSILKVFYNIEVKNSDEICKNSCFICSFLYDSRSDAITSIRINATKLSIISYDFSIFGSLSSLKIGEKMQLQTVFYEKTLPLLKNLNYLEVSKQEHPFPDKFSPPWALGTVIFHSISVPLSPIWG